MIESKPPGGTGGGGVIPPFWLERVDDENVKVKFGTVNGITPTGVDANIDVSGTDGTWTIYLRAILGTDGIPTVVDVTADDTDPVPADDADNAYILVGEVDVASGIITEVRENLAWAQSFVTCGRDPEDHETTPGTYHWELA